VRDAARGSILSGLRVVEISAFVAAPLAGAALAGMGADVIRVDPPGGGIDIHRWPLHKGRSLYWAGLNQGKRSVTIDTRSEPGRSQAVKLITAPGESAGIFLTNLAVGAWNSYEQLSELRPDLIMVVITGNRDGGQAVDYTINAAIGFPQITGPEEHDGPVNHVLPAWDAITGYIAANAILAAEMHRRRTGKGQLVEISLADVGLAVSGHLGLIAEAALCDEPRGRFGNDLYGTYAHDFATRDGRRVIVLALTARQWGSVVAATGLNAAVSELERRLGLDFHLEGDRWQARHEITALLAGWIGKRDLQEVRTEFEKNGVMWGPYQTFKQLIVEDRRASIDNPLFAEVEHQGLGRFLTAGSPVRFSGSDAVEPRPAPTLGEHTHEVLREFGLEN